MRRVGESDREEEFSSDKAIVCDAGSFCGGNNAEIFAFFVSFYMRLYDVFVIERCLKLLNFRFSLILICSCYSFYR